jgi:polysaccharide biosynthesis protein PslJ
VLNAGRARTLSIDRGALLACGAAVAIGVLAAVTTPLVVVAALAALAVLGLIWARPVVGVFVFVAIVATLPFGVIPVPLAGAQLTFVDATMLATFSAVFWRLLFGGLHIRPGLTGISLLVYVLIACAAFVVGAAAAGAPPELVRRVGKLLVSLLFFIVATALLTSGNDLPRLTRWLIVAGAIQGGIGALLMAASPLTQLALLTRLTVIGYPAADVLRYVPGPNDTYTTQLRAIGTSVDPNVFGGTLMLSLALIVVQWASPRPVLRRLWLVLLALPTTAGIVLSLSRASWLGLACGLALVGALRYRRILALGLAACLAVLVTAPGQEITRRFLSGFSVADRATAFRVGEYANALTLIGRYPWLGIGFGLSPDIDVTAGVSSVYLLVAEQTGLLGLAIYVLALGSAWCVGLRGLLRETDAARQGVCAAYLAAVTAALVAGLLDHYFANVAFPHAVALFWLYAAGLVVSARRAHER